MERRVLLSQVIVSFVSCSYSCLFYLPCTLSIFKQTNKQTKNASFTFYRFAVIRSKYKVIIVLISSYSDSSFSFSSLTAALISLVMIFNEESENK